MIYSPQNGGLFIFHIHRHNYEVFYCNSFTTLAMNLTRQKRFSKTGHCDLHTSPRKSTLQIENMKPIDEQFERDLLTSKISKPRQTDARFLCPQLKNLATSGTMLTSHRAKIDFYIDADPD